MPAHEESADERIAAASSPLSPDAPASPSRPSAADVAAIEALNVGEGWSRLLVDAGACRTNGGTVGSLRLDAFLHPDGTLKLELQTSTVDSGWRPYEVGGVPVESLPGDEETLPDALAMFRVHAARYRQELVHGELGLGTAEAKARWRRERAGEADPAILAILALGVGERWTEERWGPYLAPGGEIQGDRYLTSSHRIVVERVRRDDERYAFSFRTEVRYEGLDWENEDLGLVQAGRDEAFEMGADAQTLGTCLAAFRALLDHEGRERETNEDAIAERALWGITDEHLRSGTLSDATRAALAEAPREAA